MNEFERVSSETMETNGSDMRENCIYWTNGDRYATVNFTQVKYITRVKKLAEQFPDDVKIKSERNGVLIAVIPVTAIKVNIIKNEREFTEEEREAFVKRIAEARKGKSSLSDSMSFDPISNENASGGQLLG